MVDGDEPMPDSATRSPDQPLVRLCDYVSHYARRSPRNTAVVCGTRRYSYAELETEIRRCAAALLARNVGKGDRVAMLSTPRAEHLVVTLATLRVGAIWVGLNPRYTLAELAYVLSDCEPMLLVALAAAEDRDYVRDVAALKNRVDCIRELLFIDEYATGRAGPEIKNGTAYRDALDAASAEDPAIDAVTPAGADDAALIVYTSGTTGRPKGAVLSNYGLCFGAALQTEHFGVSDPRIVCNLPINHVGCVADICATTLVKGGTLIFQERFEPQAMVAAMECERATIWGGVPTMFQIILDQVDLSAHDLSSLQLVLWGGAAMPRAVLQRLAELPVRLMTAYGMTETACHVTFTPPDASLDDLAESIGRPDPRIPCRIIGAQGLVTNPGETGELEIGGRQNFIGYFRRPEQTRAAYTSDGWLKTGDVAAWRHDGSLRLVGRSREMFKSGGYNVYPREIELALETHPQVELAAVVAAPDPVFQEVGHAYVVSPIGQLDDSELRAFLQSRLANYKIPKRIFVRETLPLLPIGKIDKQRLKQELEGDTE